MIRGGRVVATWIFVLLIVGGRAGAQGWYADFSSALAAAKSTARPLLLIFEQEGCPDCARLETELRRSTSEAALRNAVKVKLDYSGYPRLANQFNVTATPTVILLKVNDGALRTVYRKVGSFQAGGIADLGRRIDALAGSTQKRPETKPSEARVQPQDRKPAATRPSAPDPAATAANLPERQAIADRRPDRVPGVRGNYFFYRPGGIPYDRP